MATIEQIRDAMRHVPFTVRLVDGRSFTVKHRDLIAVSPNPRGRGVTIYEDKHVHQVDVLLVQSLDYPDPESEVGSATEGDEA